MKRDGERAQPAATACSDGHPWHVPATCIMALYRTGPKQRRRIKTLAVESRLILNYLDARSRHRESEATAAGHATPPGDTNLSVERWTNLLLTAVLLPQKRVRAPGRYSKCSRQPSIGAEQPNRNRANHRGEFRRLCTSDYPTGLPKADGAAGECAMNVALLTLPRNSPGGAHCDQLDNVERQQGGWPAMHDLAEALCHEDPEYRARMTRQQPASRPARPPAASAMPVDP